MHLTVLLAIKRYLRLSFPYILFCAIFFVFGCGGRGQQLLVQSPEEETAVPETGIKISLVFGGDVMQHLPQVNAAKYDGRYDYTECFKYLKPVFDKADLVVLNLETTVSERGQYSGYPRFASPVELITALHESGADILLLANNHIADKGLEGMTSTAKSLTAAGIDYTGIYTGANSRNSGINPLLLDIKGIKLALLNYTYGLNGMPVPEGMKINVIDTVRMAADLRGIDMENTDHVIVLFHWGEEYSRVPSRWQKELARWCHEKGVGFVIGSHPHVIQPVETVADSSGAVRSLTAYSLGNLVSNQRERYTDGGMLLRLNIRHKDDRAPAIDPEYILTWVHTPFIEGRRRYYVLTPTAADTLLVNDPPARAHYNAFLSDSRELLGKNPLIKEARD